MIDVLNLTNQRFEEEPLIEAVRKVLRGEGVEKEVELSIVFVPREKIQTINRKHRGEDEVTDVIAFSFIEEEPEMKLKEFPVLNLGQIFICPSYVQENLEEEESFEKGIFKTLIHGLLHILGYEHEKEDEAQEMEEVENHYLSNI